MRTAVYVDGFNLYYGALKGTAFKWLDLNLLCQNILGTRYAINSIVYCTAIVHPTPTNPNNASRQRVYLRALQAQVPHFKPVYGRFSLTKPWYPAASQPLGALVQVQRMEEKGSDVNLAVHMVNDAWQNLFDCAVVVSNDSDLAEALRIVQQQCGKRVGLLTPEKRRVSKHLKRYSHFQRMIRRGNLAKAQLPSPIPGTNLRKPKGW